VRLTCLMLSSCLLSACSAVVPPHAWTFDPTHPQPKPVLSPDEGVSLSQRLAQLQAERTALRSQIATEPDVWKRQALYARLHALGRQLSPLERRTSQHASAL